MSVSVVVIVNPVAGGGRAARAARVVAAVTQRHWADAELVSTSGPGDASRIAADAAAAGADRVIAVGGDGTLQEVAAGLLSRRGGRQQEPVLGAVSVGRGNDLARTLRLPRKVEAAADAACIAAAVRYDVGFAGDRLFLNAAGAGFDAHVAGAVNALTPLRRSKLAYLLTTVSELRRYRNRDLVIEIDGERLERRALLVAVANGRYYGGGMMISPSADMRDGMLDVCIIGDLRRADTLRALPSIFIGRHIRHPAVEVRRGRHIRLVGAETRLHLDGEDAGVLPSDIRVAPGALAIATPAAQAV